MRDGKAVALFAYATLRVDGRYGLYDVRLSNGQADLEYRFRRGKHVTDLAIRPNQL